MNAHQKTFILFLLALFWIFIINSLSLRAQVSSLKAHHMDPYYPEYVKGQVLVKFKDDIKVDVDVQHRKNEADIITTGMADIDKFLSTYKASAIRNIFPFSAGPTGRMRGHYGKEYSIPSLDKTFLISFDTKLDAVHLSEILADLVEVEYSEPNYLIYSLITEPNDALFLSGDQWYLDEVSAPYAWDSVTGDTTQIIAIIDTGIDWDHPDLDNNIWINWDEIPDNGLDDDNNGYIDDVRGWDFFNHDSNPDDDNGHGTHVAGVAGAETNNYTGIAGVCWNSKLMPLKVLSGAGSGNIADLATAISYAAHKGATVINMSLGSYGESLTLKSAIESAYQQCILVAAAGNDHYKVDTISPPNASYAPMFPACYPFVIGVEASTVHHQLAGFSNFDPSGYLIAKNPSGFNYEVKAPGVNILSTFPNGGYHSLNGTSMASPIVAGACALLKSFQPDISNEEIFARIIQYSQNGILEIYNMLNSNLSADLIYYDHTLIDTASGADNDGIVDADEMIDLWFTVKNAGGYADSVWAKISLNYPYDTSLVEIIDSTSLIGDLDSAWYNNNIPAYTTMTGEQDPFRIFFKPGIDHAKQIVFDYELGSKSSYTKTGSFFISVQNGQELKGYLDTTLVLTPDKLWLVNQSFRITQSGILQIKPGVHLKLEKPLLNLGNINAYGTKDSVITIEGPRSIIDQGIGTYYYTFFTNMSDPIKYQNLELDHCRFGNINTTALLHCGFIMEDCYFAPDVLDAVSWGGGTATRCILDNCGGGFNNGDYDLYYNNFSGNQHITKCDLYTNNFATEPNNIIYTTEVGNYDYVTNHYWGTIDTAVIDKSIYDFWDYPTLSQVIYKPMLSKPTDSAHGFIWKVHVNDQNPQAGYIDPLGVETVKFDVFFNKPVDTTYTPLVTFGVRKPFTQHVAEKNPSWNQDSTIFTCYYDIGIKTGDGINSIRVSNGVDTAGFPIPVENNQRFQFNIQAASSTSTQFLALGGIGKIYLEWPLEETEDFLGFNLYRYTMLNDSLSSDTIRLNQELITDTTHIDYNVHPDTNYYYCYRIIGSDLSETDYSEVAYAKPLLSANGDANGDLSVDVLDITTIISYILEENPKPFLFDAADLNYDGNINILDVIHLVTIIGSMEYGSSTYCPDGIIGMDKNSMYIDPGCAIAGFQFELYGDSLENVLLLLKQPGFEFSYVVLDDCIKGVVYSLRNKAIADYSSVVKIEPANTEIKNIIAFGSDPEGHHVNLNYKTEQQNFFYNTVEPFVYPNPVKDNSLVFMHYSEPVLLRISLHDGYGRKVTDCKKYIGSAGRVEYKMNEIGVSSNELGPGVYYLSIKAISLLNGETYEKAIKIVIV
ncbi:MAG: S8 family serine peptidase [Bacteroidales bacterium]|nr:S8 family serine peptidase [Bacteroidales bacterium]